tara:strand:+ start:516 stop:1040 length:525 start_codon:yes stop_codon:yes gene_type:complete
MLGLMFGQTNVTSKLVSYDLNINGADGQLFVTISEVIGYDLDRGTIQFVGYDGEIYDYLTVKYWSSESEYGGFNNEDGVTNFSLSPQINASANPAINYYFDNNVDYISFDYEANNIFNGTLHFIVTAEFPEDDTDQGDLNDDGNIDVLDVVNLVDLILFGDADPSQLFDAINKL